MSTLSERYQQWLEQLEAQLQHITHDPVASMVEFTETIKAYYHAGLELSAYESQLFRETFFQQRQALERPSVIPESLWALWARLPDPTQVAWQELDMELSQAGHYQQGQQVGLGAYQCAQCGALQHHYHPGELRACDDCGHAQFTRRGIPE